MKKNDFVISRESRDSVEDLSIRFVDECDD